MAEQSNNRLLAALSEDDFTLLRPSLSEVVLEVKQVLEAAHQPIGHIYFVTRGMASMVALSDPDHRIEVGMIGPEGMTGTSVVLGLERATTETMVQSAGTALRLPSNALRRALRASPSLSAKLLRYVQVFSAQASQTALANGRGLLNQRLARWLLMWHDRLQVPTLMVTHEFLSLLLGVRRQGVSTTLQDLEAADLIKAGRNQVKILDREGLKRLAGGFYGVPEAEYESLLGSVSLPGRTKK